MLTSLPMKVSSEEGDGKKPKAINTTNIKIKNSNVCKSAAAQLIGRVVNEKEMKRH